MGNLSDGTTYRYVTLGSAVFWALAAALCWMTTSDIQAAILAPVFLTFAIGSGWMLCAGRFCTECHQLSNPQRPWSPSALCAHCGNVMDDDQYLLGRPGQIHLNGHNMFSHPKPICRLITLIVALGVRDRASEIVLDPDGSIRMQIDGGDTFDMVPMPPHLVRPALNLFKSLMRRTTVANNRSSVASHGEVEVIVPLQTGDQTTIRGHIRFSPFHKAERMIVQLDKLRRDHVVCYPVPQT